MTATTYRALTTAERAEIATYLGEGWNHFAALAYYAQGRIDAGEPAVVVDAPGSAHASMFDTSHLFALQYVTALTALHDPNVRSAPSVPSIDRAWENFRDTYGTSIHDR